MPKAEFEYNVNVYLLNGTPAVYFDTSSSNILADYYPKDGELTGAPWFLEAVGEEALKAQAEAVLLKALLEV